MRAEIVGVGTELLLGQIANTNAQEISLALAGAGIDVFFHSVVGDNIGRVVDTLGRAAERADAVVITGGLGPTPDDLTREAVASLTGRSLVRDETLVAQVEGIFARLGRQMPETNLRQADLPEGARSIPPEGTAPGFIVEHRGVLFFALPGVPWEMRAMLQKTVVPELLKRAGEGSAIVSREIVVAGLGESRTHEQIADIVDAQTQPTIAYRASGGGQVFLRLTAKARDEASAERLIAPVETEIRARLEHAALRPDAVSLPHALGLELRDRGLSLAAAESLTGGIVADALTTSPGASDYFRGAVVAYSSEVKRDVLGVDERTLEQHGAVSAEAAEEMARGVARLLGAEVAVSTTGVAGPAEQEGHPPGTVYVAALVGDRLEVRHVRGYGDRRNVQSFACNAALDLARRMLLAE